MEQSFYRLIGKNIDDPEIKKIIDNKQQDGIQQFTSKMFKQGENEIIYYSEEQGGISYCFENKVLTTIYLYNEFDKKFKQYKGDIPYGLSMKMVGGDFVCKFGEPNKKTGGAGKAEIAMEYNALGLEINFLARIWDKNSPITYLALYQPNPEEKICGVCSKKENLMLCGKCKLISYCGTVCQKNHWKFHKPFCL